MRFIVNSKLSAIIVNYRGNFTKHSLTLRNRS